MKRLKIQLQRKAWRYLASLLLCLVLAFASLSTWLFNSPAGARWALNHANQYLSSSIGLSISFKQLKGNLWQGLNIEGLTLKNNASQLGFTTIYTEYFHFTWQARDLLFKEVNIDLIELGATEIYLSAPDKPQHTPPAFSLPTLNLPVGINIARLTSASIKLYSANDDKDD